MEDLIPEEQPIPPYMEPEVAMDLKELVETGGHVRHGLLHGLIVLGRVCVPCLSPEGEALRIGPS